METQLTKAEEQWLARQEIVNNALTAFWGVIGRGSMNRDEFRFLLRRAMEAALTVVETPLFSSEIVRCNHCGKLIPKHDAAIHWAEYMWENLTEQGRKEEYIAALVKLQLGGG